MTFPIFRSLENAHINQCSEENRDIVFFTTLALDPLILITSLIVEILGMTGIINMPCAASYALIGVSTIVVLSYVAFILKTCHCKDKTPE